MGKPTFRHTEFVGYKANREEAPSELKAQIHRMYEVLQALSIPTLGMEGYEADDVIGTLATRLREAHSDLNVGIFTGDRDSFQLVGKNVYVICPSKNGKNGLELIDTEGVIDRFGVRPDQVVDYKALCGDASDNIPGVKGVGPKSAQKLLSEFETLHNLYRGLALAGGKAEWLAAMGDIGVDAQQDTQIQERASKLPQKLVEKLMLDHDNAFLSQKLARIDTQVPLNFELADAKVNEYNKSQAITVFDEMGFRSLKTLLPSDDFEQAVQESLF